MSNLSEVKIFSGENSRYIAEKISKSLDLELGQKTLLHFSDGEFATSYDETVRGDHVFIVQSTFPPSDNLMELLMMIDAAKRASAYKVIAVIPYFGFARQDRKDRPRVAIGAKLVANLLHAAGVDRIMTMDLHADQIQGFFDIPVDHLYGSTVLAPYIRSLALDNLAIASPDIGGSKRANSWAKFFDSGLIICHKTRERPNEVADMKVIGDPVGKNVVIVDDMHLQGCRHPEGQGGKERARGGYPCGAVRQGIREHREIGVGRGGVHGFHSAEAGVFQDTCDIRCRHVCGDHPQCRGAQIHQRPFPVVRECRGIS